MWQKIYLNISDVEWISNIIDKNASKVEKSRSGQKYLTLFHLNRMTQIKRKTTLYRQLWNRLHQQFYKNILPADDNGMSSFIGWRFLRFRYTNNSNTHSVKINVYSRQRLLLLLYTSPKTILREKNTHSHTHEMKSTYERKEKKRAEYLLLLKTLDSVRFLSSIAFPILFNSEWNLLTYIEFAFEIQN